MSAVALDLNLEVPHRLPQSEKNPRVRPGICSNIKHGNPILVARLIHVKS
jgi:hypothetical protein